ncbi:hypothetical protein SeMB42_g02106 [Synchytrium endobioticum]|uniref:Uncharacterized protein n=1 Tax=Synchytrium endobioticum TaxID=286115 RepID=A0A507DGR5_9FUNG|nr:hypothetical protein SeMB42_g02106 [Synchytrium endobioticum]
MPRTSGCANIKRYLVTCCTPSPSQEDRLIYRIGTRIIINNLFCKYINSISTEAQKSDKTKKNKKFEYDFGNLPSVVLACADTVRLTHCAHGLKTKTYKKGKVLNEHQP